MTELTNNVAKVNQNIQISILGSIKKEPKFQKIPPVEGKNQRGLRGVSYYNKKASEC